MPKKLKDKIALITGGTVISMDPNIGDLVGDVRVAIAEPEFFGRPYMVVGFVPGFTPVQLEASANAPWTRTTGLPALRSLSG